MSRDSSPYMYETGTPDERRLALLNQAFNPQAITHLVELGLPEKRCVLEIACGQGQMSIEMAKHIPEGIVVAIDKSQAQLDVAKANAKRQGITNIHFIKADIFELDQLSERLGFNFNPDLIYCRWLLVHLSNKDALKAIRGIYHAMPFHCTICLEELALNATPLTCESIKTYVQLFTSLADAMKINFNLGQTLISLFTKAGFTNPKTKKITGNFAKAAAEFFPLDVACSKTALVDYNTCNEEKTKTLEEALKRDANAGHELTLVNYQVSATKPLRAKL